MTPIDSLNIVARDTQNQISSLYYLCFLSVLIASIFVWIACNNNDNSDDNFIKIRWNPFFLDISIIIVSFLLLVVHYFISRLEDIKASGIWSEIYFYVLTIYLFFFVFFRITLRWRVRNKGYEIKTIKNS